MKKISLVFALLFSLLEITALADPASPVDIQAAAKDPDFGKKELEKMLHDRPEMATKLDQWDFIRAWAEEKFSKGDRGMPIFWDSDMPSSYGDGADHGDRTLNGASFIQLAIVHAWPGDPHKGEKFTFEELWDRFIFECFNIENDAGFEKLGQGAYKGEINRQSYILQAAQLEYTASLKTKAFYLSTIIPELSKKGISETVPSKYADLPPSFDGWLDKKNDPKGYPWNVYGAYYDKMVVPYVLQYLDEDHLTKLGFVPATHDELAGITLPDNPTREQTRDYVASILEVSKFQRTYDEHDPEVGMIEKIGSQNVDLLITVARDDHNPYLCQAIDAIAQQKDESGILAELAVNHGLLSTVIHHGWQQDAKPILIAELKTPTSPSEELAPVWIRTIISFQDPATHDALRTYFIDHPSLEMLTAYNLLMNFDLTGAVGAAWEKARVGSPQKVAQALAMAAQYGKPDAIQKAVTLLGSDNSYARELARYVLKRYTSETATTDDQWVAWFKSNGDKIAFDSQTNKFAVLPSSPPISPDPVSRTTKSP